MTELITGQFQNAEHWMSVASRNGGNPKGSKAIDAEILYRADYQAIGRGEIEFLAEAESLIRIDMEKALNVTET